MTIRFKKEAFLITVRYINNLFELVSSNIDFWDQSPPYNSPILTNILTVGFIKCGILNIGNNSILAQFENNINITDLNIFCRKYFFYC